MHEPDIDVVIVGAGLTGLITARNLVGHGLSVVLLDKARRVGGRMATRRVAGGRADHGAQFFTVRWPAFREVVDGWLGGGLVFEWSRGWGDGSLGTASRSGHSRYAVHGGMNALPQHLADGLDVRLGTAVVEVTERGAGWDVHVGDGPPLTARAVVLTAPVPQSLDVLDAGGTELDADEWLQLGQVEYAPCLSGMLVVDGELALPEPGALQRAKHMFPWIADNQRKGISPGARVATVNAGAAFSREHWDDADETVLDLMENGLAPYLEDGSTVAGATLKRWRYALVERSHDAPALIASQLPPLAFAGDAFGGARIEGAVSSGTTAARMIRQRLQTDS